MRVAIARQLLLGLSASAARRAPLAPPAFGAAAARPAAPPRRAAMSAAAAAGEPCQRLSCAAAAELAASGAARYVDVRTPEEFGNGHPPGAINVPIMLSGGGGMAPNPGFLAAFEAACADKDEQLLVGCAAGKRSEMAVGKLAAAGYVNLVDVEGGFQAWCAAGLPASK